MKIAYFDCFCGIAGDMALAALLDCGAPLAQLKRDLTSLQVEGWDIRADNVLRSGIHGVKVTITQNGQSDADELAASDHHHDHHHHEHSHEHEHSHAHSHPHEHQHGRSMAEIRALIENSELKPRVKQNALAIFERIAEAEAKMHHTSPADVHFHEIGGLDSLLDIVGVAWCLDYLGIEKIYASPLPLSSGFVDCAHGRMPVPAPATLEILQGAPWTQTEMKGELVTPTGAAILAALCQNFGPAPSMTMSAIGLGAGSKDFAERPNLLRVSIGEAAPNASALAGLEWANLALLETNIDDLNPQLWEAIFEALFAAGALDVWTTPIQMKKGRPAQMLGVLCELGARDDVLGAILRHTSTLGVRVQTIERAAMSREMHTIDTPFGVVRVKVAVWNEGGVRRGHPEWEDVKARARKHNVAAREVYLAALLGAENARVGEVD